MKKSLFILFGGRSVEHEISIRSAINVAANIDKSRYDIFNVGIAKNGDWFLVENIDQNIIQGQKLSLNLAASVPTFTVEKTKDKLNIDVVFPVLHGTDGEDGSIQGLLETINVPVIGSGVLGSAVSMDKIISKKLLQQSGIPTAPYLVFHRNDNISFEDVKDQLDVPFMIKAGNMGSSVGISKVTDEQSFNLGLKDSFQYSNEILIESFVKGRELECGIIGNEHVQSTWPGEIKLVGDYDFYTYEAKYQDENAISVDIPAQIDLAIQKNIRELSERAYAALNCNDFARVDLFVKENGEILINEINTIPGFTSASMFPSLWANMGLSYPDLIAKLLELGIKRWEKDQLLSTNYLKA
jgi:D-alanine-D-alanine ligase